MVLAAYILLAFVLVPIVEIGIFIEFGGWIGLWPTLGIILCTAVIGSVLLRQQGYRTFERAKIRLQQNQAPLSEIFDVLCLFASGLLLLTPGFMTDIFGGVLLIPFIRARIRQIITKQKESDTRGPIIEGEYQRLPPKGDPDRGSN